MAGTRPLCGVPTASPREHAACRAGAGFVLALAVMLAPAHAALVRVACKGVVELSRNDFDLACVEREFVGDGQGQFVTGLSRAAVDLHAGTLSVGAAGGNVRDVAYRGRESSSIVIERLTLSSGWRGTMPVTVEMRLRWGFEGEGEARLAATLRSAAPGVDVNRATIRISHRERAGARLEAGDNRGLFRIPEPGRYPSAATMTLRTTAHVTDASPALEVRADLAAFALPNLAPFERSSASLVRGDAVITVSMPCTVIVGSSSGRVRTVRAAAAGEAVPERRRAFECLASSAGGASRDRVRAARVAAPR